MLRLLIYDIEPDRVRTKIAKACGDYGLERIQYSAFWGELSDNRCEELMLKCRELLEDEPGRVHIFSICGSCRERLREYATEGYQMDSDGPPDHSAAVIFLPTTPAKQPWRGEIVQGRSPEEYESPEPDIADQPAQRINPFDDD